VRCGVASTTDELGIPTVSKGKLMFGNKFVALYLFRFVALLSHVIATSFIYGAAPYLVRAGLPHDFSHDAYSKRETNVIAFASVILACQGVDAALMAFGASLWSPGITLFHGVAHALGAFFTMWAVADAWGWQSIPWLFVLFTLPSFCIEMLAWRPVGPALRYLRGWVRITGKCCANVYRGILRRPERIP